MKLQKSKYKKQKFSTFVQKISTMNAFDKLKLGDSYTDTRVVTEEMRNTFAAVSGDSNPLHLDADFAATTPFKERIAHGALVSSFISKVLGCDFPGYGSVYVSQFSQFKRPVKIGDEISTTVEVKEKDERRGYVTFKTYCKNQLGKIVVDGEAVGIPPKQ